MSGIATVLLVGVASYVAAGLAIAIFFLVDGAERILPEPASVTLGARILLLPGAVLIWPVVLRRLLRSRSGS